jgi:hypothetical protein
MGADLEVLVEKAVVDTLENMSFLEVLKAEGDDSLTSSAVESIAVKQQVLDPVQAEFYLLMPRDLIITIAQMIFTMPREEVSEQQAEDVATELLNTIAGRFLNAFLPTDKSYNLGLPVVQTIADGEQTIWRQKWWFQMEGFSFCFALAGNL